MWDGTCHKNKLFVVFILRIGRLPYLVLILKVLLQFSGARELKYSIFMRLTVSCDQSAFDKDTSLHEPFLLSVSIPPVLSNLRHKHFVLFCLVDNQFLGTPAFPAASFLRGCGSVTGINHLPFLPTVFLQMSVPPVSTEKKTLYVIDVQSMAWLDSCILCFYVRSLICVFRSY